MTSFTFAEQTDAGTIYLMIALLLLVFLPTSLFFTYQLHKRRMNVTISKRYPSLSIAASICFMCRLFSSSLAMLLIVTSTITLSDITYRLLLFTDNLFLYSFFTVLLWRIWNIHYDLRWINQSLRDDQWRAIISLQDVSIRNASHRVSFYLKHNATFGRSAFIGKVVVPIILLLLYGLVQIPLFIDVYHYIIFDQSTLILCTVMVMVLIAMTPQTVAGKRDDAFYIISELRMLCILILIVFMVAVVALVYGQRVYDDEVDDGRYLYMLMEEALYFGLEWMMVMVSTFLVLSKTGELFARFQKAQIRGRKRSRMINVDNTVNTPFYRALESQEVFDSFMLHLAADFQVKFVATA